MDWTSLNTVEFSITTYCQAKCPLCARTNKKTLEKIDWLPLQHLPLDEYKNALDQTKPNKVISFCGDYGDPVMHPQVEDFLDYAVENNYRVQLHTNGGIRTKDWYEKIAKKYKNKVSVIFAIDGIDEETNSKYRVGVEFDRAWENMMTHAKHSNQMTVWNFLVFDFNYDQLDEAYKISKENNIEFVPHMNNRTSAYYNHLIKDLTLRVQLEEKCANIYNKEALVERVGSYGN
tara:strand:- start:3668 stop:4363 length:696 start_codon:yes stop_codon:yes gene_type:complete